MVSFTAQVLATVSFTLALLSVCSAGTHGYEYDHWTPYISRWLKEWPHKAWCPHTGPGLGLTLFWDDLAPAIDNKPFCKGNVCSAVIPKHSKVNMHVTWSTSQMNNEQDGEVPISYFFHFMNVYWYQVSLQQEVIESELTLKAGNPTPMYCYDCDKTTEPDVSECRHAAPDKKW